MTAHFKHSAWGRRGDRPGDRPGWWIQPPTALCMPPLQIGQAIEEVNSNNQELLRKYRRELQLRKKCHNELVRLKGNCWGGSGAGWGRQGRRLGAPCTSVLPGLELMLACPRPLPSPTPWSLFPVTGGSCTSHFL